MIYIFVAITLSIAVAIYIILGLRVIYNEASRGARTLTGNPAPLDVLSVTDAARREGLGLTGNPAPPDQIRTAQGKLAEPEASQSTFEPSPNRKKPDRASELEQLERARPGLSRRLAEAQTPNQQQGSDEPRKQMGAEPREEFGGKVQTQEKSATRDSNQLSQELTR
jgi:hypothetical protein